MQFKSVRFGSVRIDLVALVGVFLYFPASGWATLTVTPANQGGGQLSNFDTQAVHYPTTSTNLDSGDSTVSVPITNASVETSGGAGNIAADTGAEALYFQITGTTSSYTASAGSPYIMAFAVSQSGTPGQAFPIPISWNNGAACYNGAGGCALTGATSPYLYGVPYVGNLQTQTIGIYPANICVTNSSNFGAVGGICYNSLTTTTPPGPAVVSYFTPPTTTTLTGPPATTTANVNGFSVYFAIVQLAGTQTGTISPTSFITFSGASPNVPTSGSTFSILGTTGTVTSDVLTTPLILSFQPMAGSLAGCPNQVGAGLYFPGDTQIFINAQLLNGSYVQFNPTPQNAGGDLNSAANVLIADQTGPTAFTRPTSGVQPANFPAGSDVITRFSLGNTSDTIGNLVNATTSGTGGTDFYDFNLYLRDYSGYVSTQYCPLQNVESSKINTFLGETKCFIATAAFRSKDASPVTLLRRFRDRVLLHFGLGKRFVHAYYRWSPPAAEWLIDHPDFRYPVLLALVPIQVIAWLCLRPVLFLAFLFCGLTGTLFLYLLRGRGRFEGAH